MSDEEITFKAGDTVYSANGQEGIYVGCTTHQHGHVVEPGYWSSDPEDGSFYAGGVELWDEVYADPPKAKLQAEVVELAEQLRTMLQQVHELREEKRLASMDRQGQFKRLKEHAALDRIDDFLAGRITHLVTADDYGAIKVLPFAEAMKQDDRNDCGQLKLLTLFGRANGDLFWERNPYSDGSGSSYGESVFLFTNEEDALTAARGMMTRFIAAAWQKKSHHLATAVDSAKKLGMEVDPAIVDHVRAQRVEAAQKRVDAEQAALARVMAELKAAQES